MYIDLEAERRVISAMVSSPEACIDAIEHLNEDDFTDKLNRNLFLLTSDLFTRGVKPTYVEILREGEKLGLIDTLQDLEAIKNVVQNYIDAGNASYWVEKVAYASRGRKTVSLFRKLSAAIKDGKDIDAVLEQANSGLFNIMSANEKERPLSGDDIADIGVTLIEERMLKYRERMNHEEKWGSLGVELLEGLPTGLRELDELTLGYKPGDLIILGAQTGHGKTAYALNTAKAVCIETQQPLLYINTEMSDRQLTYRWGAMLSGIPLHQIRMGSITNEQLSVVINAYARLKGSGFHSVYAPNLSPGRLGVLAKRYHIQKGIKMLIVDYVGRMDKHGEDMREWQVLEDIVKQIKLLAQTLEIPAMVLVQLNEDGTMQGAKRMENEADLFLKLLPVDDIEKADKIRQIRQKKYEDFNYRLYVKKARDTASGINIPIVFHKDCQIIRQAEEVGR